MENASNLSEWSDYLVMPFDDSGDHRMGLVKKAPARQRVM